jgi:hypothetical protein
LKERVYGNKLPNKAINQNAVGSEIATVELVSSFWAILKVGEMQFSVR